MGRFGRAGSRVAASKARPTSAISGSIRLGWFKGRGLWPDLPLLSGRRRWFIRLGWFKVAASGPTYLCSPGGARAGWAGSKVAASGPTYLCSPVGVVGLSGWAGSKVAASGPTYLCSPGGARAGWAGSRSRPLARPTSALRSAQRPRPSPSEPGAAGGSRRGPGLLRTARGGRRRSAPPFSPAARCACPGFASITHKVARTGWHGQDSLDVVRQARPNLFGCGSGSPASHCRVFVD